MSEQPLQPLSEITSPVGALLNPPLVSPEDQEELDAIQPQLDPLQGLLPPGDWQVIKSEDLTPMTSQTTIDPDKMIRENLKKGFGSILLETKDSFVDVYGVFQKPKYNNKKLLASEVVSDPDLMEIVYQSLEGRWDSAGAISKIAKTTSQFMGSPSGGSALMKRNYRAMKPKKAFELWQNHQRSFDAAHAVTVTNEILYGLNASEKVQKQLAAGYVLHNQMENIFKGAAKGEWGELVDGIKDYGIAAFWTPETLLAFGITRPITFFGGKALRDSALEKYLKSGYNNAVKSGARKTAGTLAFSAGLAKAIPMASADAALAFGFDQVRQMQLINVGNQDEIDRLESAMAAAGSILFPFLNGGSALFKEVRKNGSLKDTFVGYQKIDQMVKLSTPEEFSEKVRKMLDEEGLFKALDEQFGVIKGKPLDMLTWADSKLKSKNLLKKKKKQKTDLNDQEVTQAFYKFLWFGDPEAGVKGYMEALQDAGFVIHPKLVEDQGTITKVFGQALDYMNDAQATKIVNAFEENTGLKLSGFREPKTGNITSKTLMARFIDGAEIGAQTLWISSEISRLSKAGLKTGAIIDEFKRSQPLQGPKHGQLALSMYKRLITSHLSTTSANVKGFKSLVGINVAADLVVGALEMTRANMLKAFGSTEAAEVHFNKAYGKFGGTTRKLADTIAPDIPVEYANFILDLNPKIASKLFRDIAGDGGVNDSLEMFNMDEANTLSRALWKTADAYTKGVQTVTFSRLQDSLTKRWSFGTNLNMEIMGKYGKSPEEFFSNPDVEFEMATQEFKFLLEKAAQRTMRETASVNWSSLPANNFMRKLARGIETTTNKSPIGIIVPFGSFLNTTIATAGDLSGVNFFNHLAKKTLGKKVDPVTDDGQELFAKLVVGWGLIGYGTSGQIGLELDEENAITRLENGLTFKQKLMSDGSIVNMEYEWPNSLIRASSQAIAHGMKEFGVDNLREFSDILINDPAGAGKRFQQSIPEQLWIDLMVQVGPGQAVRDLDSFGSSLGRLWTSFKEGDYEDIGNAILYGTASKIARGATRHLDPINLGFGLFKGSEMNPDLKDGNRMFNESMQYLTHLSGLSDELPIKTSQMKGIATDPIDAAKGFGGSRTLPHPNLSETMFNTAGIKTYSVSRFKGTPAVKNYMNILIASQLESESILALEKYPDFMTSNQKRQTKIVNEIKANAIEKVRKKFQRSAPKSLQVLSSLMKKKSKTKEVLNLLPYESTGRSLEEQLTSILDQEDGINMLTNILQMVETYDNWSKPIVTGNRFKNIMER